MSRVHSKRTSVRLEDLVEVDIDARAESTLLKHLNAEQRAAVTHGDAPLLVVAGAGTGKTAVLAARVATLIARGMQPERILLLTFTRRAAAEMLRRVETLLARSGDAAVAAGASRVWGGTFHAVAARLLRIYGQALGLPPTFTVLDRSDAEDLMRLVRSELDLGSAKRRFPQPSTCLDVYSRCVNAHEPLTEVLKTAFPWCVDAEEGLARLFDAYTERKERQQVLDYDDLLWFWHALLSTEAAAEAVRSRFDAVLVDEYQDTNAIQAEILALLRPDGRGVTVVGDDAQAIYGFRAATVENILHFRVRFPEAVTVTLTRNYRSTQPILDAANAIISRASRGHRKDLVSHRGAGEPPRLVCCSDEREQSGFVVDRILEHREAGVPLRKQAVLFRAAHHSADFELELKRRNVPFVKYGGLKFLEMAHVKDLVAILRLAENPRDATAAMRVLALIPGIGPATARRLVEAASASAGDLAAWRDARVPPQSAETLTALTDLLATLRTDGGLDVSAQVHAARTFLAPLVERAYDAPAPRLADLEQLEALAARFESLSRFIAEMALDPPRWTEDLAGPPLLDDDWLVLSTMHSAKGLEFDVVFVIHAADGNIPSDMATGSAEEIDEERRLFYVACTRARDHLYVCWPLRYYAAGRGASDAYGYSQRTRFIDREVLPLFDCISPGTGSEDGVALAADAASSTACVRERMTRLWS
ncbi:superfamily I DNA and RNA helicases [Coriobacteriaceae bacterium EMTCatB1]|nr:superfamily I DNA and RNA helicases [Coriobacteriaceae bacterium EMTCatB1]